MAGSIGSNGAEYFWLVAALYVVAYVAPFYFQMISGGEIWSFNAIAVGICLGPAGSAIIAGLVAIIRGTGRLFWKVFLRDSADRSEPEAKWSSVLAKPKRSELEPAEDKSRKPVF